MAKAATKTKPAPAETEGEAPDTGKALVEISAYKPLQIFQPNGTEEILAKVEAFAKSVVADVATEQGRKDIKSMARRISSTKTALDAVGKGLVEPIKEQTIIIDAERKRARDRLDALRDATLAPYEAWQEQENIRTSKLKDRISEMQALGTVFGEQSVADLKSRLEKLDNIYGTGCAYDWQDFSDLAAETHREIHDRLQGLIPAAEQREADAAELRRLREEAAEKTRKDNEDRIASEAKEKAERDAEAQRERDRVASETRVKEEGERAARAEGENLRLKKDADEAEERGRQREQERQAQKKKDDAEAERRRQADKEHRAKINRESLAAIMGTGLLEPQAIAVLTLIVNGKVPHVRITY